MTWSQQVSSVLSLASAVLVSIGGAGAILIMLSSWLGKVWAARILERERAELNKSIESTRAELTSSIEREKATMAAFHEAHKIELQEMSSKRLDALNRRRDVYARLATTMRILLRADMSNEQQGTDKRAFLAAYDEGYLWAAEPVATSVRELILTMEKKASADKALKLMPANAPEYVRAQAEVKSLDAAARELYQRCLLEMRKDCGFPDSAAEHRIVSFA